MVNNLLWSSSSYDCHFCFSIFNDCLNWRFSPQLCVFQNDQDSSVRPYCHLFTTSQIYLEPTQWPAPSWLVSSVGRAMHWNCRGHEFKSRTGLDFFSGLNYFHHCLGSVHNCKDSFHIHFFNHTSHYFHIFTVNQDPLNHGLIIIWKTHSYRLYEHAEVASHCILILSINYCLSYPF